jgi:hypothetical protein
MTTAQMKMAPPGSIFIWCTTDISYPKHLARSLGREDLQIWPSPKLDERYIRGRLFQSFVVDHAHPIPTEDARLAYELAMCASARKCELPAEGPRE